MDLLIGVLIGAIYGRNVAIINSRAYQDIQKILLLISKTQSMAIIRYMIEGIYLAIERKFVHKSIRTHDILCECNRRTCKPVSINTYARKLKALN